ncbi:hypothetical protein RI844_15715 [Thalassotalea fonticola]|uniref:CULT domain-containing protein n=1 Tax=Thalassotalea fonticola TaxID=3065649 RepID=A0ABZ0GLP7_9GAMM|nr:hypothetical protein RI844_15715 [Colwelliaceae bacterium S1-1]
MEVIKLYTQPKHDRKPFYDGGKGAPYKFKCPVCKAKNIIPFESLLHATWNWKEDFSKEELLNIQNLFGFGPTGNSHEGGWTCINFVSCKGCSEQLISYVGFNEYYNSLYRLTEQGLAHIRTDNLT